MGGLVPGHKTIADFRKDNGGAIRWRAAIGDASDVPKYGSKSKLMTRLPGGSQE